MTRRSDILEVARRVLDLDRAATERPWSFTTEPPPGCCVADCGVLGDNSHAWVAGQGGRRGTPIWDSMLIANYRTACPELARFVEMVDKLTSDEIAGVREEWKQGRPDPEVIGWGDAMLFIRQRLGLDTTEDSAALKARKETDR